MGCHTFGNSVFIIKSYTLNAFGHNEVAYSLKYQEQFVFGYF